MTFFDERDRISNQTRRFNFCKTVWGPIQIYLNGQIEVVGSRLCQEMVQVLRRSCEIFGNEMGIRMSSLKDVQGGLSAVWEIWRKLRRVS